MDQGYPKWLYAKNKAPQLVNSEAEHAALGDGWFENPNFHAEAPKPAPGDAAAPAPAPDIPKVEYPKYLYNRSGEARKVVSQDDHAGLGPGWYEHPDEATKAAAKPAEVVGAGERGSKSKAKE